MRIIVLFDLPVITKLERRAASSFRKFLIDDGYIMMQFSVYSRVCNGKDAVIKHRSRLMAHLPDNGAVRMMAITEKQYQNIEVLLGTLNQNEKDATIEQLTLL